jgi:FlaG/FlaF family flagellin (archaellin)
MKNIDKKIGYVIIATFLLGFFTLTMAFTMPQQKTYKLELTTQEVQVIYDALGELPAKVSEGIRAKVAKQVQEQNANGTK